MTDVEQTPLSEELQLVLSAAKNLNGADFMALASYCRGEGRAALRMRGATDSDIGPMRLDIDKFGDAPWG